MGEHETTPKRIAMGVFPFLLVHADGSLCHRIARRGEIVELIAEDVARGDALGAFEAELEDAPEAEASEPIEMPDLETAELEDVVAWLEEAKPTVERLLELVGDSPASAASVLAAELAMASENDDYDARKTLAEGLEHLIVKEPA